MEGRFNVGNTGSWAFMGLLVLIGILNIIQVHPVPGLIYIAFSLIYLPYTNEFLKSRFGFTIPSWLKIVLGVLVMWATLGVGDLAEIYGL